MMPPPAGPAPIALVDGRRQIKILWPSGEWEAITLSTGRLWGSSAGATTEAHSWPTWSPSGRYLAYFRILGTEGPAVIVSTVRGITSVEACTLVGRLPLYMQWSPDESRLALLCQEEEALELLRCDPTQPDSSTHLLRGAPLFFSWQSDRSLITYSSSSEEEDCVLTLRDEGVHPRDLPGEPLNFCAPVPQGAEVVCVQQIEERTMLAAVPLDGGRIRALAPVNGLVAILAGPGRKIAYASAPEGDGTPYRDLRVVDLETGERHELSADPCLAFLWSPVGDALIVARVDTERNALQFDRVDLDGNSERIAQLHATRDLSFYLRFFEQYAQSHPLVDPTGRHLLLAGSTAAGRRPRVLRADLRDGSVDELGAGLFAVYGPPTPGVPDGQ